MCAVSRPSDPDTETEAKQLRVISELLAAKADVATGHCLHRAGTYKIAKALLEARADPDDRDNHYGRTALAHATTRANVGVAQALLEAGVDADTCNPLAFAIRYGHADILRLILSHNPFTETPDDLEELEVTYPRSGQLCKDLVRAHLEVASLIPKYGLILSTLQALPGMLLGVVSKYMATDAAGIVVDFLSVSAFAPRDLTSGSFCHLQGRCLPTEAQAHHCQSAEEKAKQVAPASGSESAWLV